MAKKQSRRTVSLNRYIFEAAKQEAARRNQTLASFVEAALVASGVPSIEHPQQTPAQVAAYQAQRRPSRERQLLGDGIANALGYH